MFKAGDNICKITWWKDYFNFMCNKTQTDKTVAITKFCH